ncbi:hypothetical protein C8J56DRAFT_959085 [Mycena floridula]|nr:hypothetical protein C8J56DRAFT_959085 [Mycena floridula]
MQARHARAFSRAHVTRFNFLPTANPSASTPDDQQITIKSSELPPEVLKDPILAFPTRRDEFKRGPRREGRKGVPYGHPEPPQHSEEGRVTFVEQGWEEECKVISRRIIKAERDERIDVTLSLTEARTYMGGFTVPTHLRTSSWFPGGRYHRIGKSYEPPAPAAYTPHTVFVLESRYPVRQSIGMVEQHEHIVSICRTCDFQTVLKGYNRLPGSDAEQQEQEDEDRDEDEDEDEEREEEELEGEEKEEPKPEPKPKPQPIRTAKSIAVQAMDNARWPWLSRKGGVASKWWTDFDDWEATRLERGEEPSILDFKREAKATRKHKAASTESQRSRYRETLKENPFWRPLITVGFSTRPLALSFVRKVRGLSRGQPFVTTIASEDRNAVLSFSDRMRCVRLNRARALVVDMAQLLAGFRGGFIGIRFSVDERGRGINGERLDRPIEMDKRIIEVGFGDWYQHMPAEMALWRTEISERVPSEAVRLFQLDDFGNRTLDGKEAPWPDAPRDDAFERLPIEDIASIKRFLKFPDPNVWNRKIITKSSGLGGDPNSAWFAKPDEEVPKGYIALSGGPARTIMRAKLELLYKIHCYELASWRATRQHAIEVPLSRSPRTWT